MPQDTEKWDLLQRLFHLAEATPEPERERVLEQHCSDPELRHRVLAMLQYAYAEERNATGRDAVAPPGRMGPYSLLRLIGTGGMGAVWLAERILGSSPQRVALKLIAPHAAGSAFIERFHREQHILASLDHPHITRLLDAGMDANGQPYLVMEYVEGVHLDQFCNAEKLDVRSRLALFLQVCDAIGYAHRNLTVHLDLKPSNVLVNGDGNVKLLDFGTSKLIEPDAHLTTTLLATPTYASPEQLRNESITTACDIYALGVILFELLAGRGPVDKASPVTLFERALNEVEPDRLPDAATAAAAEACGLALPRLRQTLGGDLATIVAKCLRPRPRDRYPTVDALIGDLTRYLDGRAVLARPQTVRYRIGKFVRRHRAGVAAGTLATIALLATLAFAGWRQHQAVVEGRRAMRMQTFMYGMFKLANIYSAGNKTMTVPQFLALGAQKLPEYIQDPADLRRAQLAIAESLRENQDLKDAEPLFKQVLASAQAAGDVNAEVEAGAFVGDMAYRKGDKKSGDALTAESLRLSSMPGVTPRARVWSELIYGMQRDDAGFFTDENLRLLKAAAQESRQPAVGEHDATLALYTLGEDYLMRGMLDEAEQAFRKTLLSPAAAPGTCGRAGVEGSLGNVLVKRADHAASIPLLTQAYDGYTRCSGANSIGALTWQGILAEQLTQVGRAPEALAMMQSAMPVWRKYMAPGSDHLFNPLFQLAHAEVATGHFTDAERNARELLQTQEGRTSPWSYRLAYPEWMLAEALAGQGRWVEARPHAERADAILAHDPAPTPERTNAASRVHQLRLEIDAHVQAPVH